MLQNAYDVCFLASLWVKTFLLTYSFFKLLVI